MIDVEGQVFTPIATMLRARVPKVFVTPEYVPKPPRFPAVSIVETTNTVAWSMADSGGIEHGSDVMYQVDVYTASTVTPKAECKRIIGLIDEQFAMMGFTRTYLNATPNMDDALYRMTARYTARVGENETIYRRR